jgi:hypothetical protein
MKMKYGKESDPASETSRSKLILDDNKFEDKENKQQIQEDTER